MEYAILAVAVAIVLEPFADRVAARLLPRPNKANELLERMVEKAMPIFEQYLGARATMPTEELIPCGDHHERYNEKEDRTETHHCVLAPGHEGDHECGCGASWTQHA